MKYDSPSLFANSARAPKQALLIGLVAFVSYAYFYSGGGWNQNTRFDFVRAMVERGTLSIDAYHQNTGDKVFKDGHYYSDKAPGQPLLAVPAAVATRAATHAGGRNPLSARSLVALAYICTLFSAALPTALACVCLYWIALRLGTSTNAAAFGALAMGLGSPMWAYATLFWAHALAGACLLFAFAAVLKLDPQNAGREAFWGFIVGLVAGWATVTEYPAAPASAILGLFAIARVWPSGWPRRLRVACGVAGGARLCDAQPTRQTRGPHPSNRKQPEDGRSRCRGIFRHCRPAGHQADDEAPECFPACVLRVQLEHSGKCKQQAGACQCMRPEQSCVRPHWASQTHGQRAKGRCVRTGPES